jgi:hypothetical protein
MAARQRRFGHDLRLDRMAGDSQRKRKGGQQRDLRDVSDIVSPRRSACQPLRRIIAGGRRGIVLQGLPDRG